MKLVGTVVFLSLFGSAIADDAAWTYVGGAGNFTHNKQIRMLSERVDIRLMPSQSHVHATFEFRNEGPATTVTMAFPEEKHGFGRKNRGAIHDFFSSVDGKAVKVRRKRLPENQESGSEYTAVWLKTVHFAAHRTRHVLVDYSADNGDIDGYVTSKYILRTGATWNGTIRDAVINVDWSAFRGMSEPSIFKEAPDAMEEDAEPLSQSRHQSLRFHNLKPSFDIAVNWTQVFGNFLVNGELISPDGIDPDRYPYVFGEDSDPRVGIRYVPEVLTGYPGVDDSRDMPEPGLEFEIGNHRARVLSQRVVEIDGRKVRLRRSGGVRAGRKWIYLRDMVRALGGKFHFNSRLDRVVIWVK